MASLVSAVINLFGLVAISGAILLTALVLRNPLGPKWLRNETVAYAAALVLTVGICVVIPNAATGFIDANIHYSVAVILTGAVLVASSYILWKAFNIRERLERTETGRSPFARERPQLEIYVPVAFEQANKLA
jgi:uncharacterized membrane-anchored protein